MSLEVKTDIKSGDEIFIYYGAHFFDTNNGSCECFTCELLGRGYFSKFNENSAHDAFVLSDQENIRFTNDVSNDLKLDERVNIKLFNDHLQNNSSGFISKYFEFVIIVVLR